MSSEKNIGYGTRVNTPAGPGMVVGRTSRTYRVLLDDGASKRNNYGRNFGQDSERGFPFSQVAKRPA